MEFAVSHGIVERRIVLDPGSGFGKTTAHNLELLRRFYDIVALCRPVEIGTWRKSFLGKITAKPVEDRIAATIATNVFAYMRGARVFRVHDAAPIHDALAITAATVSPPWASTTPTSSTMSTT
jgi:dihydropteroate synthase